MVLPRSLFPQASRWVLVALVLLAALTALTALTAGCGGTISVVGRWEQGGNYVLLQPGGRFEGELGVARTRGAWAQRGNLVDFVPEREEGGLLGGTFTGRLLDQDTMAFQVSGIPGELVLRRVTVVPLRP